MLREFADQPSFADQVAEATGLAPVFASGVLERCCKRAGVTLGAMKPSDLEALLPHLETSLLVYKSGREVLAALDRLKRLATQAPTAAPMTIFPADEDARSARHESFIRERSEFPAPRRTGSR